LCVNVCAKRNGRSRSARNWLIDLMHPARLERATF
jgi:hypothetical protein